MDAAQGLAHGAAIRLVAGAVIGKAVGEDDGAINGANDFERGDALRGTGQPIATVGAGKRLDDAGFGQLLHDLGEQGDREMIGVGDFAGAGGGVGSGGQVAKGDQPVVGFFGQFEHWNDLGLILS